MSERLAASDASRAFLLRVAVPPCLQISYLQIIGAIRGGRALREAVEVHRGSVVSFRLERPLDSASVTWA